MGLITIPKKKVGACRRGSRSAPSPQQIDLFGKLSEEAAPIIDQIAELQLKLKPLADAKKALEAKRSTTCRSTTTPRATWSAGAYFEAEIGKRGKSRSIKDMALAKKALGDKLFMQLATVKLGDLDKYLTPPQLAVVLEEKRTAHSVKVTKRVWLDTGWADEPWKPEPKFDHGRARTADDRQ